MTQEKEMEKFLEEVAIVEQRYLISDSIKFDDDFSSREWNILRQTPLVFLDTTGKTLKLALSEITDILIFNTLTPFNIRIDFDETLKLLNDREQKFLLKIKESLCKLFNIVKADIPNENKSGSIYKLPENKACKLNHRYKFYSIKPKGHQHIFFSYICTSNKFHVVEETYDECFEGFNRRGTYVDTSNIFVKKYNDDIWLYSDEKHNDDYKPFDSVKSDINPEKFYWVATLEPYHKYKKVSPDLEKMEKEVFDEIDVCEMNPERGQLVKSVIEMISRMTKSIGINKTNAQKLIDYIFTQKSNTDDN
jgi:hypothetical protein